jgi:hypothetical protein
MAEEFNERAAEVGVTIAQLRVCIQDNGGDKGVRSDSARDDVEECLKRADEQV